MVRKIPTYRLDVGSTNPFITKESSVSNAWEEFDDNATKNPPELTSTFGRGGKDIGISVEPVNENLTLLVP